MERIGSDGHARLADRDQIESRAAGIDANLLLCAHTHIPRIVGLTDGRLLINPGSVGCPAYDDDQPTYHVMQTGSPDAFYAIVEKRGEHWRAAIKNVRYDTARMATLARRHNRLDWASAVATGWLSG